MLTALALAFLSASQATALPNCAGESDQNTNTPGSQGANIANGAASPSGAGNCTVKGGDKTINSRQLYPEKAVFHPGNCAVYMSVLWNTSIAVWDPVKNQVVDTISDTRFTGKPELHASGVTVDNRNGRNLLSMMFNNGEAFDSSGKNIKGANNLVKYDFNQAKVAWAVDLSKSTNGEYGGFQDMEHDDEGNTFVCGTYPASLMRVSVDGQKVDTWYKAENKTSTNAGISGLAMYRNKDVVKLLATDQSASLGSQLVSFDPKKQGPPTPINEKGSKDNKKNLGDGLDGVTLPEKYGGKILLVSDAVSGTFVLQSDDDWNTFQKLGLVKNARSADKAFSTATFQMGDAIYVNYEFFFDATPREGLPNGPGNKTDFFFDDITKQVEDFMKGGTGNNGTGNNGTGQTPQAPNNGAGQTPQAPNSGAGQTPQDPNNGAGQTPQAPGNGAGQTPQAPGNGAGQTPQAPPSSPNLQEEAPEASQSVPDAEF